MEGHALRSSGLLHVEASLPRVSRSGLKTGRGAMTGGARGIITEVASMRRAASDPSTLTLPFSLY
jgi:hypothetical protein